MPRAKDVDTEAGRARHGAKYQRILDAALEVFAARGFHAAKIAHVAARAEVADGTIYLYFKNKQDLRQSLLEAKLELVHRGLRAALAELTGGARLRAALHYHLRMAREVPALGLFLAAEVRGRGAHLSVYARRQLAGYLRQWRGAIDAGRAGGLLRPELQTRLVQQVVLGALEHTCGAWAGRPGRHDAALDDVGRHLEIMLLAAP